MSEGKVSARKTHAHTIVSKGPDVCWTPRGNTRVKVAYNSIAFMDTAVRVSTSVRNNGDYDFQLNSRCATSTGHEPGIDKGVHKPGYLGPAHVDTAADFLYSEGFASVSHRDPAWINGPDIGPREVQKARGDEDQGGVGEKADG